MSPINKCKNRMFSDPILDTFTGSVKRIIIYNAIYFIIPHTDNISPHTDNDNTYIIRGFEGQKNPFFGPLKNGLKN